MFRNLSRQHGHGGVLAAGIAVALFTITWAQPVKAQFVLATNNSAITITGYNGPGGNVIIPPATNGFPVINIASNAFINQSNITSITIPDAVTNIGDSAFHYCTSLSNIAIPDSVTNMGRAVFSSCFQLTNVTLPANLAIIPGNAFAGCTSLTSITIPSSVRSIGIEAFAFSGLTNAVIPNSVTNLGDDELVGQVFVNCHHLISVTLPNSVSYIPIGMFAYCNNLASITIPNRVALIGYGAFYECTSLTNMTIPSSVTNIDTQAFSNCTNLIGVYFAGNQPDPGTNMTVFAGNPSIAYYLPGKTGWGSTYDGIPVVLWNPQANSFDETGDQFGFQISGPSNGTLVVEACTNLANPVWVPVSTNILSAGGTGSFNDPHGPATHSVRYYRFRSP